MNLKCPQLESQIAHDGHVDMMWNALYNAYFREGWAQLLAWAAHHGYTVTPPAEPQGSDFVRVARK